ncbi:PRD domain-containing protein [Halobacillus shinanisalinarum]|uniref:PRD domain-containing protein n=1 Tax=Halobacillus shinanisalinarum TaxID=2932258 RepID=A0ABY4H3I0_9BACI|nr:PRD domain-containing protein [Halobacillus shinanisalinarum]UOQ94761.1 PRD domain-containing protein [Halobacillus shinanisalinarum]
MEIKKIFNNNVALTEDPTQTEMVVMGKGLAFQKKVGDQIDADKIEKTFITPSESFADKLYELLDEIPYEIISLSKDITDMASNELDTTLNDSLYLALSDHIHFAVGRSKNGLPIKNALMWEVKKFYKAEYQVARKALDMIEHTTGVSLPEDEAASIALHLFNARQDSSGMEETMAMTAIVHDVTSIVKYHYGIDFDEGSMNYNRFITHLRYFAYRILRGELNDDGGNGELYEQVKMQYPEAYECSKKVQAYMEKRYQKQMTKDELTYFMIHIHRVSVREQAK